MHSRDLLLIDTSAWILYFRGKASPELRSLIDEALTLDFAATTEIMVLEILRGAESEKAFYGLQENLGALKLLSINSEIWPQAQRMGFRLQRKGSLVPSVDILIAAVALHYDCSLLHADKHFNLIAKAEDLKAKYLL